jgi:hypothetical protein
VSCAVSRRRSGRFPEAQVSCHEIGPDLGLALILIGNSHLGIGQDAVMRLLRIYVTRRLCDLQRR